MVILDSVVAPCYLAALLSGKPTCTNLRMEQHAVGCMAEYFAKTHTSLRDASRQGVRLPCNDLQQPCSM